MSIKKVRNSIDHGALVEMVATELLLWSAVAVAARGIKADADANVWMLSTGKKSGDPFWLGDLMIEFGDASEEITPLWERYKAGEVDDAAFEETLDGLVTRMEAVVAKMHRGKDA